MSNNHAGELDQQSILERIKAARSEAEPVEPTEDDQADDESIGAELEAESEEDVIYEESENDEEDATAEPEDEEESTYLIGDEEITLEGLKALKEGNLRQSDYTKKTTELAEQRKALEAKAAKTDSLQSKLSESINDLQSQIDSELENVDWEELADEDPGEFLKMQKRIEKKQASIAKAKQQQQELLQAKAAEESKLLANKMTSWHGEKGEANRKADTDLALKYASQIGLNESDLAGIVDHRLYVALIDAAKYQSLKTKAPAIKKKVSKAPKVTPTNKAAKRKLSKVEESRNRLRKTGSDQDARAAIKAYLGG